MRHFLIAWGLTLVVSSLASAEDPEVKFPAPQGWAQERIKIPPTFAPKMTLKGFEEIRFAPGMFQADSDTFFTYALVFVVAPQPMLDQETLNAEVLKYYRGLGEAVGKSRQLEVEPEKFVLEMRPIRRPAGQAQQSGKRYAGDLKWMEPFVTGKQQTLHLEVDVWPGRDSEHRYVFMCVSPQKKDAAAWNSLKKLRNDFYQANLAGSQD